jgi:hypothetical protein
LNEYGAAGTNRLQVSLMVNDSRMLNYPAKLQMLLERNGSGIVMRTNEYAAIPPIMLTGNVTEVFTSVDLGKYMLAMNNVFSGFDQSQYAQTGRIPDGQYRIGFRVVDAQRNDVVLSNTAWTQYGWFILNDPPTPNLPRNKSSERVNDPQIVKLEWFPRHLGSMNAAFNTSYKVELFAIRVPGMEPNQVALSMHPNFTDVTNQTNYTITPDKYMLEPGIEYAWRVKAMAGNDELTLFQNNGYSEVFSFVYGSLCPVPENVVTENTGNNQVGINWDTDPLQTSYETRFRLAGQTGDPWHIRESYTNNVEISKVLTPGMTYEYQVKAKCTTVGSEYSPLATFTIPAAYTDNFECGLQDNAEITNKVPKASLRNGEIIYYGQFPIKLTEISGSNGNFSGKGRMRVPFMANIQVNMQFENIRVNEYNEVYEGELVSIYNPDSKHLIDDLSDYFAEGDQTGNIIDGVDSAAITTNFPIDNTSDLDVIVNGNTVTVISDDERVTATIDNPEEGTTIEDSNGNLYAVDGSGNVTQIGRSGNNEGATSSKEIGFSTTSFDPELAVTFENSGKWALDNYQETYEGSKFATEYEQINDIWVSWKFVPIGKPDKIRAKVSKGNIDPGKLVFKTPTGTEFFAEKNGNAFDLTLIGAKQRDGYEVYAVYQENDSTMRTLGKVNIASYPLISRKVTIVPMQGGSPDKGSIENAINQIYKPYGITWTVTIDDVFTDRSWDTDNNGLKATGTEFYSAFTDEMRALNSVYSKTRGLDNESVYLFWFAENTEGERSLNGDMPLESRFGYIFSPKLSESYQTIAHELAHGVFQLRHTFSNKYNIAKKSTTNLLDYSGGSELKKYQWDVIHDPQNMLFAWAQDEEEGAYKVADEQKLKETLEKIGRNACAYCQRCDKPVPIEGALIYSLNNKTYKCSFGKLKDDNTIESFDKEIKNNFTNNDSRETIDDIVLGQDRLKFVILISGVKQNLNTVICDALEDYEDYCNQEEPFTDAAFTNKVISDIEKCSKENNLNKYFSGITSTFASSGEADINNFESSLKTQLNDATFSNVKFAVNIFNFSGEKRTLYTKGISSEDQAEITLNYYIDNAKSEVKVSIAASDSYLQAYESKVSARASEKGYEDIDVSALRQQVLDEIHSSIAYSTIRAEKEQTEPEEKAKECLRFWQVAQKNVKNVWDEGTMHKGTWHSNDPESMYDNFPGYAHFGPVITGAADEVIDEVAGIPLMIKTGYEIMSDDQKREALVQTFTSKEGLSSLWDGLKEELTEFSVDGQRQTYAVSQITTMVGFAVITGGGNVAVKGAKKGSDVLGEFASLASKFEGCPKLTKRFKDVKKLGKKAGVELQKLKELTDVIEPKKLENALKYLGKTEIDDVISKLHKLRELKGVDNIVNDLGHNAYTRFLGSRFVLDYASKLDDALIAAKKISFEAPETFSFGGKDVDRFYDIVIEEAGKAVKKELKAWSKWHSWSDDVIRKQFVRDLANDKLTEIDELNWVFKKTDGITEEILKSKVIAALESKAGKEALKQVPLQKVIDFTGLDNLNEVAKAQALINHFKDIDNFKTIFKVVE